MSPHNKKCGENSLERLKPQALPGKMKVLYVGEIFSNKSHNGV